MGFCLHELITLRLANAMWGHCCLCPGSRLPMRAVGAGGLWGRWELWEPWELWDSGGCGALGAVGLWDLADNVLGGV